MRVMFKKDLYGARTVSIAEIQEAAKAEEENFISCILIDRKTILKFVPTKVLMSGIVSKALFDLLTFGYFDFTHWDVYSLYEHSDGTEEWVAYHKEEES